LRFFFRVTLDRPEMGRYLTLVPLPERLRTVLSQEDVARLLEAAPGVKYKAALGVAYGAGLRVSEVANLKISDNNGSRPGNNQVVGFCHASARARRGYTRDPIGNDGDLHDRCHQGAAQGYERDANRGHVSHAQLKVMSAIETCRTAALH
jgi:hypothetical protein